MRYSLSDSTSFSKLSKVLCSLLYSASNSKLIAYNETNNNNNNEHRIKLHFVNLHVLKPYIKQSPPRGTLG